MHQEVSVLERHPRGLWVAELVLLLHVQVRDEGRVRPRDDALKRLGGRQLQNRDLLVKEVRDLLLEKLLTLIDQSSLMHFLLFNCRFETLDLLVQNFNGLQ